MDEAALGTQLSKLRLTLEIYGSDRDRWPASARLEFRDLIASNREARQLIGEFAALDRLIVSATQQDDIAALALSERVVQKVDRKNIDRRNNLEKWHVPYLMIPKRQYLEFAAAAAVIALVFGAGLSFGTTGLVDPIVQQIAGIEDIQDNDDPLFNEDIL